MASGDAYGFFWNSQNGDREYNAESFEMWLKKFFTTGVFYNELEVTEYSGLTVNVASGYANLSGKVMFFDQGTSITLDVPHSTYPRIDNIVIQRNDITREITIEKVTGEYSGAAPTPTEPIRSGGIFQIVLAQIYVEAGASSITQADITDTRPDPSICGYVAGTVDEIDFKTIIDQFESSLEGFETEKKTQFDGWFEEVKGQLSTDAAGHLQNQIIDINSQISNIETDINDTKEDFQGQIDSINDQIINEKTQLQNKINAVEKKANTAETKANSVEGLASSAETKAKSAESKASTALSRANTALNTVGDTQSTTINHSILTEPIRLYKYGKIVIASMTGDIKNVTGGTSYSITIPAGFRPTANTFFYGITTNYDTSVVVQTSARNETLVIYPYQTVSGTATYKLNMTWVTD